MDEKTMRDCYKDRVGTVYKDYNDKEFRIRIQRGIACLCAYVGVLPEHLLYGVSCEDIDDQINCHGGLTFSSVGCNRIDLWPAGFWWFGWDYGHAGDKIFTYTNPNIRIRYADFDFPDDKIYLLGEGKEWGVADILAEIPDVLESFRRVKPLARYKVWKLLFTKIFWKL